MIFPFSGIRGSIRSLIKTTVLMPLSNSESHAGPWDTSPHVLPDTDSKSHIGFYFVATLCMHFRIVIMFKLSGSGEEWRRKGNFQTSDSDDEPSFRNRIDKIGPSNCRRLHSKKMYLPWRRLPLQRWNRSVSSSPKVGRITVYWLEFLEAKSKLGLGPPCL